MTKYDNLIAQLKSDLEFYTDVSVKAWVRFKEAIKSNDNSLGSRMIIEDKRCDWLRYTAKANYIEILLKQFEEV